MSPILDLQRRYRELGRIRLGVKTGRAMKALDTFRLTSASQALIEEAAGLWGGTPQPWADAPDAGQYEVVTATDRLPIIVPPYLEPVSQWLEQWSKGGCTHRCDGVRNHITDHPCSCDPDNRACKPTTRISVMLPDLSDVGVWRLETKGWNAGAEMPVTLQLIAEAAAGGQMLPGTLRIEHRSSVKGGETHRFVVPVIDLEANLRQLTSGTTTGVQQLSTGSAPATVAPGLPSGPEAALPAPTDEPEPPDVTDLAPDAADLARREYLKAKYGENPAKEAWILAGRPSLADDDAFRSLELDIRALSDQERLDV